MIRDGKVKFHDDLGPLMKPIDDVCPAPYNYNNGDVEQVMLSIEKSGMYRPVYVQQSTGDIIAGNHTWMACKELGATKVPVVSLDVDDVTAKKIMLADNRIAGLAKPDNGLLLALLQEIDDSESDTNTALLGTGYTPQDMEVIRALNEIPLDTEEFRSWPNFCAQVPPHVLRGFMWMTREADTDRARFELLLRMAGWNGEDE